MQIGPAAVSLFGPIIDWLMEVAHTLIIDTHLILTPLYAGLALYVCLGLCTLAQYQPPHMAPRLAAAGGLLAITALAITWGCVD